MIHPSLTDLPGEVRGAGVSIPALIAGMTLFGVLAYVFYKNRSIENDGVK